MPAPATLLVTGDLHLGRFPSYVPASDTSLSVEAVWEAVVTLAIEQEVDAVVLTGDVADQDNKLFEAIEPVRRGVERLGKAGIQTIAVSGNHDFDVLHRLGALLDDEGFTLLGAGGKWEALTLRRSGEPLLQFVGWSFPSRYARDSPIHSFSAPESEVPTLGLVHGDLGALTSPYAPLDRAALAALPVKAWLLGHIHRPAFDRTGSTVTLYPGSPQPLDPGEAGVHGPWLVTVTADGHIEAEQHALATVRYDVTEVDLSEANTEEDVEEAFFTATTAYASQLRDAHPSVQHAVLDLAATGTTPAFSSVAAVAEHLEGNEIAVQPTVIVRRVRLNVRPPHDLAAIAERNDPASAVAQLILNVEAGRPEADAVIKEAVRSLAGMNGARAFTPLHQASYPIPSPEDEARALLVSEGLRLLDTLLAQTADDA